MRNTEYIGCRRNILAIQSQSTTQDQYGQPLQTWTTICTLQGKIRVATQREVFQANQLTSQVTHVIEAWWVGIGIMPGMRAVYGPHIYRIQAVNNLEERNMELRILCLELNATE
jgi:SPP1 family predicted phage head-tail adaptor